jgi:hypothetical protein
MDPERELMREGAVGDWVLKGPVLDEDMKPEGNGGEERDVAK